jgi:hypothetical protein
MNRVMLCFCFVIFAAVVALAQCNETGDAPEICCEDYGNCQGHCIQRDQCNQMETGYCDCSTGYGVCCNIHYSSSDADGEHCEGSCDDLSTLRKPTNYIAKEVDNAEPATIRDN